MSVKTKNNIRFEDVKHVYFLGIGGIGMSAIARYFRLKNKQVSGYDRAQTPLTKKLEEEGMKIHYTEDPQLIPSDIDMIVYTPAIPAEHLEWEALKATGLPIMKRAEVLGLLSRSYKTIAVAGTHGKTSTSSMTSYFLRAGGIDATAFLGGIVKDYGSNFVFGESDWVVVEADEFDRSFMHLSPEIAVLLSMDPDHLDIYGDHEEMLRTFRDFTLQVKEGGSLLIASDLVDQIDLKWRKALLEKNIDLYSFGVENGWFHAEKLVAKNHRFFFDFLIGEEQKLNVGLSMPGNHNVSNAAAALGVASLVNADFDLMEKGIPSFKGILRRFDFIVQQDDLVYIDDYAHHPTEINAAISAARSLYPDRKLTVIFQPHLFSRTRDFMEGFAEELSKVDELILMDIYPAREKPIEGIATKKIKELINRDDVLILNHEEVANFVDKKQNKLELLMTLGAGDIDKVIPHIKRILTN
ncbi:UDP-N-acetylmuramate--L-alanine ligase [Saprospiraceae bacterium]|nr:UDP-N-acetylmuramate--L-alanine ligase [Saprospiraceae bacterium]